MAEQIFIRLNPGPTEVDWWVLDAQGHRRGGIGHGRLEDLTRHVHNRRVIVIVPSSFITFMEVRLPASSRRRWTEAIPFMLEEQLASDVETLHFAYGEPDPDGGALTVAVVSRAQMASWLAPFETLGIRPDLLWPDLMLVPWTPGSWSLAREGDRILLRSHREQGFNLEAALAEAVFSRLWSATPDDRRPREIVFFGAPDDPFLLRIQSGPGGETVTWTQGAPCASEEASRGPLTGLNLLQGPWAPSHHRAESWRRWKPTAYLTGAWAGLLILYLLVRVVQVNGEAHRWRARLHQAFHAALPGQPYVSPRAQIEQALRQTGLHSRRTRAFIAFLAHASRERPSTVRILSLHYGPNGLELQITSPSHTLAASYLDQLSRTSRIQPSQLHWVFKPGHVQAYAVYPLGQKTT